MAESCDLFGPTKIWISLPEFNQDRSYTNLEMAQIGIDIAKLPVEASLYTGLTQKNRQATPTHLETKCQSDPADPTPKLDSQATLARRVYSPSDPNIIHRQLAHHLRPHVLVSLTS